MDLYKLSSGYFLLFLLFCACQGNKEDYDFTQVSHRDASITVEKLVPLSSSSDIYFSNSLFFDTDENLIVIYDQNEMRISLLDYSGSVIKTIENDPRDNWLDKIISIQISNDSLYALRRFADRSVIHAFSLKNYQHSSFGVNMNTTDFFSFDPDNFLFCNGSYMEEYPYIIYAYQRSKDQFEGLIPHNNEAPKIPLQNDVLEGNEGKAIFLEGLTDEIFEISPTKKIEQLWDLDIDGIEADDQYWEKARMDAFQYLQKRGFFNVRSMTASEDGMVILGTKMQGEDQQSFIYYLLKDLLYKKRINLGTADESLTYTLSSKGGQYVALVDGYVLSDEFVQNAEKSLDYEKGKYYLMYYTIQ